MAQRVLMRNEVGGGDDSVHSGAKSEEMSENCSNVSDSMSTNLDTSSEREKDR